MFSIDFRVLNNRFGAVSRSHGGLRELRQARRKRFHLSWSVVTIFKGPYAQILILVNIILVNFFSLGVIASSHEVESGGNWVEINSTVSGPKKRENHMKTFGMLMYVGDIFFGRVWTKFGGFGIGGVFRRLLGVI